MRIEKYRTVLGHLQGKLTDVHIVDCTVHYRPDDYKS